MTTDQLSVTFAALSDPTRRAILARVAKGEVTVKAVSGATPNDDESTSSRNRATVAGT